MFQHRFCSLLWLIFYLIHPKRECYLTFSVLVPKEYMATLQGIIHKRSETKEKDEPNFLTKHWWEVRTEMQRFTVKIWCTLKFVLAYIFQDIYTNRYHYDKASSSRLFKEPIAVHSVVPSFHLMYLSFLQPRKPHMERTHLRIVELLLSPA
jgi:hypothetical protein